MWAEAQSETGPIGRARVTAAPSSRGFCPTCGSPFFLTLPAMPEVVIVIPAILDDPGVFKPAAVTWTSAGYDWNHLDPAITKFERMPS